MIAKHKGDLKNKSKKAVKYIPLTIASVILVAMVGGIIYLIASGGIFNYIENKKLSELAGDVKSTTLKVNNMEGGSATSCKNKKEIDKELNNFEISYQEEETGTTKYYETDSEDYIEIKTYTNFVYLNGLSDRFYARVTNDYDKNSVVISSQDNKIKIPSPTRNMFVTLYVKLYVKDEDCNDTLVKSLSIEMPKLNMFYTMDKCEPYRETLKYCKKYTWEDYQDEDVNKMIAEYENIKNGKNTTTTSELTKEEKEKKKQHNIKTLLICVLSFGIIVVIGAACVVKRKEER